MAPSTPSPLNRRAGRSRRAVPFALGAALLALVPALAGAAPAVTNGAVNLRAGPDGDYPLVRWLPEGTPVDVQGCLDGYRWCDVIALGDRGWVHGRYLSTLYQHQYAPIVTWGAVIGLPIIGFTIGSYWDDYYRYRPWYRDRPRWEHRHYPPPQVRPPPRHDVPAYRPPPRPDPRRPDDRPLTRPPEFRPPAPLPERPRTPTQRPPDARRPVVQPPAARPPESRPSLPRPPQAMPQQPVRPPVSAPSAPAQPPRAAPTPRQPHPSAPRPAAPGSGSGSGKDRPPGVLR